MTMRSSFSVPPRSFPRRTRNCVVTTNSFKPDSGWSKLKKRTVRDSRPRDASTVIGMPYVRYSWTLWLRVMPVASTFSSSNIMRSACSTVIHWFSRINADLKRPLSSTSRSSLRSAASTSRGAYVQPSRSSNSSAGFSAWLYSLSLLGEVKLLLP